MKQFLLTQIKKNPTFAMIICCAVPLAALWALSLLGVLGSLGYYGIMLLCPLLHLILCKVMHTNNRAIKEPQRIKHIPPSNDV